MVKTADFHIGDVLSITTGRLVSLRGMDGIYAVLNFMTRGNLFTHQLPRAMDEMMPVILDQHPELADVDASGMCAENHLEWLGIQVKRFGPSVTLTAAPDDHLVIAPSDEPNIQGKRIIKA